MKKTLLRIISSILLLFIISGSLFSCKSGETASPESESNAESNDATDNENIGNQDEIFEIDTDVKRDGKFMIFNGKEYTARVVVSNNAGAVERQVSSSLRSKLKDKTKVTLAETTDYLKSGQSYDPNVCEILIGKTNHPESTSIYDATAYNNYGIKMVGNKLILYFATASEGEELVNLLTKAIKTNNSNELWIEDVISVSKVVAVQLTGLPKYPSTSLSTVDCGDNTSMVVAKSTDLTKFNEYCKTLTTSGYVEYSKRENVDGSYFRTYTKGTTAVTAYFSSGRKQARIIVGPLKDIPPKEKDTTSETFTPSVTMIGPSESVSGSLTLIYQLANGKFLIIDGGIILADRIYKELRELQPNATKFTIAGWFISHPHSDHQDGIEYFLENHAQDVDIEGVYVNYATASYYNKYSSSDHKNDAPEGSRVTRLRELLGKYLSHSTKVVKPHTGQVYTFGSASVEIISTVEDILPVTLPHVNESSMVIRVTVAGQSTMVLADASGDMKGVIMKMYNSHLKSDMVTLAHHGVWDTNPELYNIIKGKVLFWPNNTEGARTYYTNKSTSSNPRKAIQAALDNATDVFLAKGTDTKLNLPYKPVGNKQSFINSTLK